MPAALLFQLTSLLVSVLMVPLFLRVLTPDVYLLWLVFTTIGGMLLQIEASIQTLMVRRMALASPEIDPAGFAHERARARTAYRRLSVVASAVALPGGIAYIHWVVQPAATISWLLAWIVVSLAYTVNFLCGPNNCTLLSTGRNDRFFLTMSMSRVLHFGGTLTALLLGFGLTGISVAFALAVAFSCVTIARQSRRTFDHSADAAVQAAADRVAVDETGLLRFGIFTLAAFVIYRGAVMLVIAYFPGSSATSYGLALQAYAIVGAVAVLPLQVRLHRLVVVRRDGDAAGVDAEVATAMWFAFLTIAAGLLSLTLVGAPLLKIIGSGVAMPPFVTLAAMAFAFLVEALILVLINLLLLEKNVTFVRDYVGGVVAALSLAALSLWCGGGLVVSMLVLPALVQALVTLPLIARRVARLRKQRVHRMIRDLVAGTPTPRGLGRRRLARTRR